MSSGGCGSATCLKDATYIIDLCDEMLGQSARREYRGLLKGDPGAHGRRSPLPVDAFYPDLNLVIEYHEVQHAKPVRHFDKPWKMTNSRLSFYGPHGLLLRP